MEVVQTRAYVHINALAGGSAKVVSEIKRLRDLGLPVKQVDWVFGDYDVIVTIDAESEFDLVDALTQIQELKSVARTSSTIALSSSTMEKLVPKVAPSETRV